MSESKQEQEQVVTSPNRGGAPTHTGKVTNVFEAILKYGHDEDFAPLGCDEFEATDAPAGSEDKIEEMRRRVQLGLPLWHEEDRCDYSGLTGAVRPRE